MSALKGHNRKDCDETQDAFKLGIRFGILVEGVTGLVGHEEFSILPIPLLELKIASNPERIL